MSADFSELNKEDVEVRVAYFCGMVVTSQQIKMLKFDLEMRQHYQQLQDEHDTKIQALRLMEVGSHRVSFLPYLLIPIAAAAAALLALR